MRALKIVALCIPGFIIFASVFAAKIDAAADKITWFGQSALKIECEGKTVYIDPFQLKSSGKADVVLISHSHSDHLSLDDISKVADESTVFLAPENCERLIAARFKNKIIVAQPGKTYTAQGLSIEAVPAYNILKTKFHPITKKWLGFIISGKDARIYYTGDTERIPEMKKIKADIVLMPLGQVYTMTSIDDAVAAVKDINPKIAIPIHYGLYEGKEEDAQEFADKVKGRTTVVIKTRE